MFEPEDTHDVEKSRSMSAWDRDEYGHFANHEPVVAFPEVLFSMIPIVGVVPAVLEIIMGCVLWNGRETGVPQSAIRTGQIGMLVQALWVVVAIALL